MKFTSRRIAMSVTALCIMFNYYRVVLRTKKFKNYNDIVPLATICPGNFVYFPYEYSTEEDGIGSNQSASNDQLIPKLLYQTSKSRCMHPDLATMMQEWRNPDVFPGFSYFLYDDEAMDDFLYNKERWEKTFPSLHLALQCIDEVHNPTMKADIWRYLVLWEYGGIYADIDTVPKQFNSMSIQPDDDALSYLEGTQNYLAQAFLVVSPHHPFMFYAVHAAAQNVLNRKELSRIDPAKNTGPRAIVHAAAAFMNNATAGRWMSSGTYVGKDDRSIRVDGSIHSQVQLDGVGFAVKKKRIYNEMNMTHYPQLKLKQKKGSCYHMMNATKTETGFEFDGNIVNFISIPHI